MSGRNHIARFFCLVLPESDSSGLIFSVYVKEGGNRTWVGGMRSQVDRSRMVAQNSHTKVSEPGDPAQNRSDDFFVEILVGLDFSLQVAFMAHLIGGLDMDEDQIKLTK